jgi:hypothetical protein
MTRTALAVLTAFLCVLNLQAATARSSSPAAEVRRLLTDRPQIAEALATRPHIVAWIELRFVETEPPLAWDSAPPLSGRGGEFDAGDADVIRLRIAPDASGIDQLSTLIFELHNAMGYRAFNDIHERAVSGRLSRDEYARAMLEQEIVALRMTRDFLAKHLPTLTPEERRAARRYYRYRFGPVTLDERVEDARRQGVDLLDHYRALYDAVVLSERKLRRSAF